jgi:hypothetical protein
MAKAKADWGVMSLAKYNARVLKVDFRIKMYVDKVVKKGKLSAAARVRLAGQFLLDKTRVNISRPVRKERRSRVVFDASNMAAKRKTYTAVTERSKPGEFPRADTTMLMKTLFHTHDAQLMVSRVGTPLKYGLILETRMNRSFLRRTWQEIRQQAVLLITSGGGSHTA